MHQYSLAQLSSLLQKRKISSTELTSSYLKRIQTYAEDLNCFITDLEESALTQAKRADEALLGSDSNPLTGIPIAHKDIFCTDGIRTTCASRMLDNFIAPYDATIVSKIKDNGMVTLGKTNMDEFAMGSSSENSFYGPVKNPWDKTKVPGGSSGGSATAVAARLVPIATGTDTGGSIRQPAGFCGITGLKPTYGRVSRYGMIAFASSLDQGGPLAQNAEDAALLLNAMAGYDKHDSTSVQQETIDYTLNLNDSIEGLKIGLPNQYFDEHLDSEIADTIQTAIKTLESLGAKIKQVDLPNTHLSVPAYYVIAPAECSSNLARFDGVRYGYRCDDPKDLTDLYCRSRGEGFGTEVKRRIMIGTYVLSAGYYDAYYLQAQKIRRLIRNDFQQVLKEVDIILGPISPSTAFTINEKTSDPVSMYLSDIYTVSVNLAGLPGLSLPAGFINGLPVGFQIIGSDFSEARLLNIGHRFQQATDWHTKIPGEYQ